MTAYSMMYGQPNSGRLREHVEVSPKRIVTQVTYEGKQASWVEIKVMSMWDKSNSDSYGTHKRIKPGGVHLK